MIELFPKDKRVGIFRGFSEGGLEFHADLVLQYKNEFQNIPMHGQFLLVQLESENEAVLGRITSISSQGRLASSAGEDYGIRALLEDRSIPEDLLDQYLKYKVDMRVLGLLRLVGGKLIYAASHRRLPHVGSKIAFLSDNVLREITGHNLKEGAELGFFALGEFIYSGDDKQKGLVFEEWMQIRAPKVVPRFVVSNLVARRSFVFARAGFGKSNLVKLLFSDLYKKTPTVSKRGGKNVPVGTIIFDPDGEYYWPDDKNRPGLCDVPDLEDKVVVFTKKQGPSKFYQSFVASDIKLDIRRLRPSDVISIALSPEKQDQQNVRKLKGLNNEDWKKLVDEIYRNKNASDEKLIAELLRLKEDQVAETVAARANMTTIVKMLHDPGSQMMDILMAALKAGKICIVDVSQLKGPPSLILSGLILQKIFDHNQNEFTNAQPETIPVIAVVEEAQSVLGNSSNNSGEGPYVTWVKEGRKYDLGSILITQQPGSIPGELLSQGDNWFIFHLLSAGDLQAVKKANAHFSDDILSSLLNEPIPGHGVFWSSAGTKEFPPKAYPIPIRVMSFESINFALDPEYKKPEANTFAKQLKNEFLKLIIDSQEVVGKKTIEEIDDRNSLDVDELVQTERKTDVLELYLKVAIDKAKNDSKFIEALKAPKGKPWFGVQKDLENYLPKQLNDMSDVAYRLVPRAMDEIFGTGKWETVTRPSVSRPGQTTRWIVLVSGGVPPILP
jgi:uncharacterized protein